MESNGETNNSAKRQLLNLYCKNKNLEKATEMKNVNNYYILTYLNKYEFI